jgi:WD40 repeat protein
VQSGLLLRVFQGHTEVVRTLQFDSEKIISGSYDGTVRVWSLKTGECTVKLPHHSNSRIFKVIFNDTKIVSCLQSGLIVIYNFAHNIPNYKIFEV